MKIRKLVAEPKTQETDTNWRADDMPPRFAPVFNRTRPIRSGWQWRSAQAVAGERTYVLTVLCNPTRGNWQAMLALRREAGASLVARLEDHGTHPGLHAHADCERGGEQLGPDGIDNLARVPSSGSYHRRVIAWTEGAFWEETRKFFNLSEPKGMLL